MPQMVLQTCLDFETVLRFHLAPQRAPEMDWKTRLDLERATHLDRWMERSMERWMEISAERSMDRY